MKVLSRDFTKKEKILLVVLVVIILALCYYRFVYVPINESITEAQNQRYSLEDEELVVTAKYSNLKKMSEEVEELKQRSDVSLMPSYNGSKLEVAFLNNVLNKAIDYDVTFTTITRTNEQIRRNFTLSFTAASYAAAEEIITDLYGCDMRLLIGDISMKTKVNRKDETRVSVSLTATFYETMVDGIPDGGLPADSANKS